MRSGGSRTRDTVVGKGMWLSVKGGRWLGEVRGAGEWMREGDWRRGGERWVANYFFLIFLISNEQVMKHKGTYIDIQMNLC